MRLISNYAAIILLSTVSATAMAGEVSQQGADDIRNTLTKYLPKDLVDSGFLTVRPADGESSAVMPPPGGEITPPDASDNGLAPPPLAGTDGRTATPSGSDRYELVLDFQPLLDKVKLQDFVITGLKPFVHYLTPQDDGLWRMEANQSLDIKTKYRTGEFKTDMAYTIDRMTFDGLFDPEISYFTEAKWSANAGNLHSATNGDTVDMSFNSMEQALQTTRLDDDHVTIATTVNLAGLTETFTPKSGDVVALTAEGVNVDVRFEKFNIGAFRDLVLFVLDRINKDKMTAEEGEQLRAILRANMPFGDKIEETLGISDLKISGKGMSASVGKASYGFDFNGIRTNSAIGLGFKAGGVNLPSGILPPGSEEALPDEFGIGVVVTDLNLEGAANYFLDHADLSAKEPLTPTESKQISRIILPDGKLHVQFRDVYAKSAHYDIEMVGSIVGDPDKTEKASADVTIYARNLDATIAFLQSKSSTIPEFGQASFGAQMMKGFAKQEADGRYYWNIVVDETGAVKINGQEMPH